MLRPVAAIEIPLHGRTGWIGVPARWRRIGRGGHLLSVPHPLVGDDDYWPNGSSLADYFDGLAADPRWRSVFTRLFVAVVVADQPKCGASCANPRPLRRGSHSGGADLVLVDRRVSLGRCDRCVP